MKIVSLSLSGYRQFLQPTYLSFPGGLTGICGPNGVGKSKLIEAIGYALYGPKKMLPRGDTATDVPSSTGNKVTPSVTLVLDVSGQRYEIVRGRKCSLRLAGAAEPIATGATEVTNKVVALLRLPPDAYLGTFVARQKEVAALQSTASAATRRNIINRLIGISLLEKAIVLAQSSREEREKTYTAEYTGAINSVDEVATRLEEYRSELSECEKTQRKQLELRTHTSSELASTQEVLTSLQSQAAIGLMLEKEKEGLEQQVTTLTTFIQEADTRIQTADTANGELSKIHTLLDDTRTVQEEVAYHVSLLILDAARLQIAHNEHHLATVVQPRIDERTALETEAEAANQCLQTAKQLIAELSGQLIAAKQALATAQKEESLFAARVRNVGTQGASGICDACGQPLGENYAQALSHLEAEHRKAEGRKNETTLHISSLKEQIDTKTSIQASYEAHLGEIQTLLVSYDADVRRQIEVQSDIDRLSRQLQQSSKDTPVVTYHKDAHEKATAKLDERSTAQAAIGVLEERINAGREARESHEKYSQELRQAEDRKAAIEEYLRDLSPLSETTAAAEAALDSAKLAFLEADQACRTAQAEVASAKTRVTEADAELTRAQAKWTRIAALDEHRRIAQTAEETLAKLLGQIAGEARPHIVRFMEGWVRSLMGPQFQRIELTEDYKIRADNGSGLHQIDHFSGGEQTLMAVMLRVAISLYCQERAGYSDGFLILDEVFGDQDEVHRHQLVQFLENIKPHYNQILIVNHVSDVTGMLDSIIEVRRTGEKTSEAVFST